MKKLLALLLALMLTMTCFAGCSSKDGEISDDTSDSVSDSVSDTELGDVVIDGPAAGVDDGANGGSNFVSDVVISESDPDAQTNDVATADIAAAIKELMGENYLPSEALDNEYLENTYGVKAEWIDNYYAEIPMISFHIDTLIAIKAAEGQADNVETALNDYLAYTIENSRQYPVNIPKINASRVYRLGDYVFYIMLGSAPDEYMDDENASYNYCVQSNQNVVDKINELLVK